MAISDEPPDPRQTETLPDPRQTEGYLRSLNKKFHNTFRDLYYTPELKQCYIQMRNNAIPTDHSKHNTINLSGKNKKIKKFIYYGHKGLVERKS